MVEDRGGYADASTACERNLTGRGASPGEGEEGGVVGA
jgi:hypothetical protein